MVHPYIGILHTFKQNEGKSARADAAGSPGCL